MGLTDREFLVTRDADANAYREASQQNCQPSVHRPVGGTPLDILPYREYKLMKQVGRTYQMYGLSSAGQPTMKLLEFILTIDPYVLNFSSSFLDR